MHEGSRGKRSERPSTRCLHDLGEFAFSQLSNEQAGRRPYDGEMGDDAKPARLTVIVFYRERIAMPPNAALIAISRTSPSRCTRRDGGEPADRGARHAPIDVEIPYDPSIIEERLTYAVRATIEVDEKMWWTSTQAHHVLTHGAPDHVEVMVSRVSG